MCINSVCCPTFCIVQRLAERVCLAKGMVATYSETRLLAPKVTVTAGMDIDYLDAIDSVLMAQPPVNLEYQATAQTVVSAQYWFGTRRRVELYEGAPDPDECVSHRSPSVTATWPWRN